ncbi:PREDICTED: uncharacterized protein LOC105623913 [Atta cephalotes]|uniref:Uncharacterized protein n=1 Tax=Atta cephalotes TaxID=12957 RepID=A0A158NT19_ATTCE|nr:PREDICTED: uncharacterized protein LOC105623913 [Atta cephalotes]
MENQRFAGRILSTENKAQSRRATEVIPQRRNICERNVSVQQRSIGKHLASIASPPRINCVRNKGKCNLKKLSDSATKHLHTLQALKRPTMHWDDLLVPLLTFKLDSLTLREWRTSLTGNEPSLKQLLNFIADRCQVLEHTIRASFTSAKKVDAKSQPNVKRSSLCATVKPKCNFCQGQHVIYYCKNFMALPVSQRAAEIRSRKLCVNCLRSSHASSKCISGQCKVCQAKHNKLHIPSAADPSTNNIDKEVAPKTTPPSS